MSFLLCANQSCARYGSTDCRICGNNRARNKPEDFFVLAEDRDFSTARAANGRYKTMQIGSAEHGGLKCPACGHLNNSYTWDEKTNYECQKCGLPLTLDYKE